MFGTEEEPSPSALYENCDVITINVFDEIIIDHRETFTVRKK